MTGLQGYIMICRLDEVDGDLGLRVQLPDLAPLAVWHVDGQVFVTDDTCTHGQASLVADGMLDGFVIECGLHMGAFDIRNGEVVSPPCKIPLGVYPSIVVEGDVWAKVSKKDKSL